MSRKILKRVLVVAGGLLMFLAIWAVVPAVLFLLGDEVEMCRNSVATSYPSPDKRWQLIVFVRDCGATTDFSTQASLLAFLPGRSNIGPGGGNLFVADSDHGSAPTGPGGGPEVKVRWLSDQELVLSFDRRARVFRSEPEVSGISVHYERVGPSPSP